MSKKPVALLLAAALAVGAASAADEPLTALPYTPGLDLQAMDTRAAPCEDFYQYACGGWIERNPIPPDQARWDVYAKLADENKRFLWGILDTLAIQREGRSPPQQQIGDLFASCMDESGVDAKGMQPLAPWLRRIDELQGVKELPALLAALHLATGDEGLLFGFGQNQDFGNSSRVIAFVMAGGLSLPDRDHYVQTSAKMRQLRAGYTAHVARMFELLGHPAEAARREAAAVLRIETELARPALTRVQQRDPKRLYNKVDARGLQRLAPRFDWAAYLQALGVPALREFNITEPAFVRALDRVLRRHSLADLKTYLRWHAAHALAPQLAAPFFQEDFAFFGKALRGIPEPSPRWRRCVTLVDHQLGEALGQEFVRRAFGPEQKRQTEHVTAQVEAAMAAEINALDWMSPATKTKALEKLAAVVNKVGYPERWRDYGPVRIVRDDLVGNVVRATEFEQRRQLAKIGQPVDRGEWSMTPPTVNAYYNAQTNDINFPAGILQPPLFDPKMDDAPNYGNTGATIGHELTHGFDDEGRQFDAEGNLKNWWTLRDEKAFNRRAQCLVDQYGKYTVVDDIRINSRLTLGEDLADLGGLVLALIAWKTEVAAKGLPPDRDGLTPIQRFFVGAAQWACESVRPEELRINALTDPHSPGKYRVNGLVANFPEFAQAFACKPGQPMAPLKRCKVW
ncbi:M13 family metallopeptidase [Ideonella sp.]|uniref:M13 family metallopeptidase n=1 Tax=Ideonella sp. TaxID=1929293 RepID=UPI002B48C233|nr:M13 family metallopeptidase [Ideonella sp.]HJV68010.1 M13 family metallopeptidase [Ideonella sp.]